MKGLELTVSVKDTEVYADIVALVVGLMNDSRISSEVRTEIKENVLSIANLVEIKS